MLYYTRRGMVVSLMAAVFFVFGLGCRKDEEKVEGKKQESTVEEVAAPASVEECQHWKQVKDLYNKVKKSGEKVPDNALQWAKEDIKKIGTWQYKIVFSQSDDISEIEEQLNDLGADRWECFWVEKTANGKRFFLKKAGRSYFQATGHFVKYIPMAGGGS